MIFNFTGKSGGLENIHFFFNKEERQPDTDAVMDMKRHLEAQFTNVFGQEEIKPLRGLTEYNWSAGMNTATRHIYSTA